MKLSEVDSVEIKDTVDDSFRGGYDGTLYAIEDGQQLGYLSYSVYRDSPAIKMIWVAPAHRRRKIGSRMLKHLQMMFPDNEIDWGYTTDDGSNLRSATKFNKRHNTKVTDMKNKLVAVKSKLQRLDYKLEKLRSIDPAAAGNYARTVTDKWNKLNDLEYKLEQRLLDAGPEYSRLVAEKISIDSSMTK
jgi:GNAT superfamily N-acetyltransferase